MNARNDRNRSTLAKWTPLVAGSKHKQYVFDGKRIRAVDPAVLQNGETRHDRVSAIVSRMRGNVFDAFFPDPSEVGASVGW